MPTTNVYYLKLKAGDARDYEDEVEAKTLGQAMDLFLDKTPLKYSDFSRKDIKQNITNTTKIKYMINKLDKKWGERNTK